MTAVKSSPFPPSIDEHPDVIRHARQLSELQQKLRAAHGHRADLLAEHQRLRTAAHEADVAAALGDVTSVVSDPDRAPRLAQLDGELARAEAEEAVMQDALGRLMAIAAQTREQAQQESDAQLASAARALIARMVPLAEQVSALNLQLLAVAARVPYGTTLSPPPQLFDMWLQQLRSLGGR